MVHFVDSGDESADELAPVIPLFGGAASSAGRRTREGGGDVRSGSSRGFGSREGVETGDEEASPPARRGRAAEPDESPRDLAEKALLRKLRTRSLSIREARTALTGFDLAREDAEDIIEHLERLGYLDDAQLAEQLIHAGSDRKGQGRTAIAQTLSKRGVAREVADAALSALPDDDAERALEFARSKAGSMRSLDRDTALRRLTGQLARRGYGGSMAMTAARTALDETGVGGSSVRFR